MIVVADAPCRESNDPAQRARHAVPLRSDVWLWRVRARRGRWAWREVNRERRAARSFIFERFYLNDGKRKRRNPFCAAFGCAAETFP
jgi:hypothetical protein